MYFEQNWGPYGDPDKHVETLEYKDTPSGIKVRVRASTGLGDAYYQVYVDNIFAGAVWCPEGLLSDWLFFTPPGGSNSASVVVFNTGASPNGDFSSFAALYEESPQNVTANWSWTYEVIGTADNLFLTSWVISGLKRTQTSPGNLSTRGNLPVTLSVSGGTATVNVGALAQGSGPVGSTVTLSAINSSGVTGSVAVDALAEDSTGTLVARWPRSMGILRDTFNPPTTEIASIRYDDAETNTYVDRTTLTAGTYYYAFQGTSDTDDLGDKSTATAIVVSGAPEAPTDLAYVSGNAAATVISFTASATPSATYNVYVKNPDDAFLDTETPALTLPAGSTGATLPAITGTPGVAQVLVRAELGGVEELNGDILFIEYDSSGVYVSPRPNTPQTTVVTVDDGLDITVRGSYNTSGEDGEATELQLFTRTPSGSYDFATVEDTGTLGDDVGGVKTANLVKTFVADGWYYVTLKAATATGTQSVGSANEVAVYVSDGNISSPTGTFTLSRG